MSPKYVLGELVYFIIKNDIKGGKDNSLRIDRVNISSIYIDEMGIVYGGSCWINIKECDVYKTKADALNAINDRIK